MARPSLFSGSSSEGLEFARAARSLLAQDAEVTLWNEGFFSLGNTFIETLVNALPGSTSPSSSSLPMISSTAATLRRSGRATT
jgi:hypothetical protein